MAISNYVGGTANVYQRTGQNTFNPVPIFVANRLVNPLGIYMSSNGEYLAVANYFGNTANVYQRTGPSTFNPLPIFVANNLDNPSSISMSSDGTYLVVANSGGANYSGTTANVYQRTGPSTFNSVPIFVADNLSGPTAVAMSSDGSRFVVSSFKSNTAAVYQMSSGTNIFNPTPVYTISDLKGVRTGASMSSDGSTFVLSNRASVTANVYQLNQAGTYGLFNTIDGLSEPADVSISGDKSFIAISNIITGTANVYVCPFS